MLLITLLLLHATPSQSTTARHTRNSAQIILNYGQNGHPYDAYSSVLLSQEATERELIQTKQHSALFNASQRYPVKKPTTSPTLLPSRSPTTQSPTFIAYDAELYEPLRIHVDTHRLKPLQQTNSPFITHLTSAATTAANFWSRHLSVIPVASSLSISRQQCPLAFEGDNDKYEYSEVDMVIYIFADEGPCLGEEPPIAFSDECAMDQFDRPIAGWLLLCSENFSSIHLNTKEGTSQKQKLNEVLQHELGHILGMSGSTYPYWRDPLKGGAPRTPRPLVVGELTCINGTTINTTLPSTDTVKDGVTDSGIRYFEIVTPTVVNIVSNQFNCPIVTGARLDNFEHFDCIGSHWSTRYFAGETMVSRNMPWEQSVSAVTLGLFEDTGWYRANYTALGETSAAAEPWTQSFGYGAGCDFMNQCILDDNVPEFGRGVFCKSLTRESEVKCDVSHRRFAKCDLVDYSTYETNPVYSYMRSPPVPSSEYHYFTNTNLGAFMRYDGEYCPTYAAPPYFTYDQDGIDDGPLYTECASSSEMLDNVYNFESFGTDTSRCFNTRGDIERPLCLDVKCVLSGDLSVVVTVTDGEKVICERDGQFINLQGLNVQIECPRREVICPEFFCPANCSGRGWCKHQTVNGCQCFDSTDNSLTCENSPIQPPDEIPAVSPTLAPSDISSTHPSFIPSTSPTNYEEETNFPSIIDAIIRPTLNYSVYEEASREGNMTNDTDAPDHAVLHSVLESLSSDSGRMHFGLLSLFTCFIFYFNAR